MRFSKNYQKEPFLKQKNILSESLAGFFVFEESVLIFLIVYQAYKLIGIEFVKNSILLFQHPMLTQNVYWFFGSILVLIISYVAVAVRDVNVMIIHKNLFKVIFDAAKNKATNMTKADLTFIFGEVIFASILAMSIFLYLDPEIDIQYPDGTPIPFLFKLIGFIIFLGISLLLFSHTKQYRAMVYGPTPIQKRLYSGKHELKRITNTKTGTIRMTPKSHYSKNKLIK